MSMTRRFAIACAAALMLAGCEPPARTLRFEVPPPARAEFFARLRSFALANRFKYEEGATDAGGYQCSLERDDVRIAVGNVWIEAPAQEGQAPASAISATQFDVSFYPAEQGPSAQEIEALAQRLATAALEVAGVRKLPSPEPAAPEKPRA